MKKLLVYKLLIVLLMWLVWAYFYNKLPDMVPVHWWLDWKPDRMWSKIMHITMFPLISLWMVILFYFLPKLDPKKENYEKFWGIWEIFQFSILWFFAYIYFLTTFVTLNPEYNISKFVLLWIWVLFIILWNYMWKIRQNYFIGIKLPWTLANEEVWNKTHRFGWKMFMLAWILFIINAFFLWQTFIILWFVILAIIFAPIVYSFVVFKKGK